MAVTIRRNFPPLTQTKLLTESDWEAVGQMVRQNILQRTEQGIDADGTPFQPYSAAYALQKGRELLGAEASMSNVDLTVSGEMLRAIGIEATEKGVTLFFTR
jgi:hypothetical protein